MEMEAANAPNDTTKPRHICGAARSADGGHWRPRVLDTTPGVTPGSEALDNLQGDTLSKNANDITIIIVRPQDAAPITRAP